MSADHVLDAIDGALADYATSVDAMRWTPDELDGLDTDGSQGVFSHGVFAELHAVDVRTFTGFVISGQRITATQYDETGQIVLMTTTMYATETEARAAWDRMLAGR